MGNSQYLGPLVMLSGGAFLGEGGGFHAVGVPTIGYIPVPQHLCAMSPDGEISTVSRLEGRDLRMEQP